MNPVYQKITDKIVAALEAGTVPWRRSWDDSGATCGLMHNAVTGRPYSGINQFLLLMAAEERGLKSTGWITPNKAKELELDFKGARTETVVWWKRTERMVTNEVTGEDERKSWMYCKTFRVIPIDECRGENLSKLKGLNALTLPEELEDADELIVALQRALELPIKHRGNRACYIPSRDEIHMPPQDAFESTDSYRATAFHECAHSTGHKKRLDRDLTGRFGSESYSFEELVAELSSAYIGAALNLPVEIEGHAAYIESWLKVLKNDPKALMSAASMAQKATNYIFERLDIEAHDQQEAA